MTHRERLMAVLNYEQYDRLPVIHFGFWPETVDKWASEGHIPAEWAEEYWKSGDSVDGSEADVLIGRRLGFDYNYYTTVQVNTLWPQFEQKVVKVLPDGSRHVINEDGAIVLQKDGARCIPMEIDHLLKDRESWEKEFKPRLQWSDERIDWKRLEQIAADNGRREYPLGLYCGSLFGRIRNWLGLVGVSYLYVDDEDLYDEIIDTLGELQYRIVEALVNSGIQFDFAHFWEDIAGRDGPLVTPSVFYEKVGPKYKRITDLLHEIGRAHV